MTDSYNLDQQSEQVRIEEEEEDAYEKDPSRRSIIPQKRSFSHQILPGREDAADAEEPPTSPTRTIFLGYLSAELISADF